ncbi:histidinol dehydrogenase [Pedobacter psychrotolerans]|uniref:Histidinol dehydrogenase n=1 Tax=Pedobacter psychrotolerans TaxID=1843235 RepID=A0A4R2HMZ6_9SPHI|nr:histidinol dehydrogenase [Pedobacter psychrotolerans]TCO31082.1 histidinol dehydrogenase [Pedobacter psychrotolerans]GGE42338.1 histidinol dehydrogenase [Pedobacter psychrotolerans]
MKIYNYTDLSKSKIEELCSRQIEDDKLIGERVSDIIETVKKDGDKALFNFAKTFDKVSLEKLFLDAEELKAIASTIPDEAKQAINTAYQNIKTFHQSQLKIEDKVETMPGVVCWRESRAIEKVGLYIPGGTAVLPSTFLMLAIPAIIAGCKEIIVCSPPQSDGKTNCYLAYCAILLGIDKIYLAGGAQAVAAMAFGTESIPQVYKIFGPGNRYVTTAKTMVQNKVAIDMPAGPSEVLVLADETANPSFVAADLLAQTEHGIDSQAILISTSNEIIAETLKEIENQLAELPRKDIAAKAIANSYAILTADLQTAMGFSNQYAPEHLILATDQFESLIPSIINAGSVFLGNLTPESAGDYASGTNHTLPTSGFAKAYSGVSLDTFIKKITFQHLSNEGLQHIGRTVETLAAAEGLQAHKNAITIRLKKI